MDGPMRLCAAEVSCAGSARSRYILRFRFTQQERKFKRRTAKIISPWGGAASYLSKRSLKKSSKLSKAATSGSRSSAWLDRAYDSAGLYSCSATCWGRSATDSVSLFWDEFRAFGVCECVSLAMSTSLRTILAMVSSDARVHHEVELERRRALDEVVGQQQEPVERLERVLARRAVADAQLGSAGVRSPDEFPGQHDVREIVRRGEHLRDVFLDDFGPFLLPFLLLREAQQFAVYIVAERRAGESARQPQVQLDLGDLDGVAERGFRELQRELEQVVVGGREHDGSGVADRILEMARAHGVEDAQMEQVDLVEDAHADAATDIFEVDGNYEMFESDARQQPAVEFGLLGLARDVVQRNVQYGLYIVIAERLSDESDAQQLGGQHVQLLLLLDVFIVFVKTHGQDDKHARDKRVFEHVLAVNGRDAAWDDPEMRDLQKAARELETQPLVVEVEPQKLVADALERVAAAGPVEQLGVDLLDDVQRRERVVVGQQLFLVGHRKVQLVAGAQRLLHQVQQRRELAVERLDGLLDAAQARVSGLRGCGLRLVPNGTGAVFDERAVQPQSQTPLAAALAGVVVALRLELATALAAEDAAFFLARSRDLGVDLAQQRVVDGGLGSDRKRAETLGFGPAEHARAVGARVGARRGVDRALGGAVLVFQALISHKEEKKKITKFHECDFSRSHAVRGNSALQSNETYLELHSKPRDAKAEQHGRKADARRRGGRGPASGQRLSRVVAVGDAAVDARGARRDVARLVHKQHLGGPRRAGAALDLPAAHHAADLLFHPLVAIELRRRRLDDGAALDHLELFEAARVDVALELDRTADRAQDREKVDPGDLVVVDDHQPAADLGQRRELDGAHLLVVDHAERHARGLQLWQLELAEPVVDELRRVLHHLQVLQVQAAGVLDGDGVGPGEVRERHLQVSGVGSNQQSVGDLLDRGVDALQEPVVVDIERLERLDVEAGEARERGVAHHDRVDFLDALVEVDGAQNRKHLPLDRVDAFQLGQRNGSQRGQRVEGKRAVDRGELDTLDSQQTARVGHAQGALDVRDGAEVQTVGVVALDDDVAGDDLAVVEVSHVAGRVDVVVLLEAFRLDLCVLCVVGVVGSVDEPAGAAACQRAEDG
ncbi:hypothetical protein KL939_000233 [Ogataea angusta]|nr:hypothetical protein KL939_000233 [Ogataea angusta]